MKTAISIPDHLFTAAERMARRLKKSRSQLYSDAISEYLARRDFDAVTEAMDKVCAQVDTAPDAGVSEAARRILGRTEW